MINNVGGQTIGVFEILGDSGKRERCGNVIWDVKCTICGGQKLLPLRSIKRYKSCGCKSRDLQSASLRKSLNRGGWGEIYATHWTTIRKNAKQRNLPFKISVKYAWDLFLTQNRRCILSGLPIAFSARCWSRDATASLDRIDSNKGYIVGNVQWVHKMVNFMKQEFDQKEFVDMCGKIWHYANSKQTHIKYDTKKYKHRSRRAS